VKEWQSERCEGVNEGRRGRRLQVCVPYGAVCGATRRIDGFDGNRVTNAAMQGNA
jgi:hypothetical protein